MKKKFSLSTKIFIGLILGVIVGVALYPYSKASIVENYIIGFGLHLVGTIFIKAIKMMVVPLVLISLTCGAASVGDVKKLGRIGIRTMAFYLMTTAIAITLALTLATVIEPGSGLNLGQIAKGDYVINGSKPFTEILLDMIPTNPIQSLVEGNMLQIIVFSLLLGTSITMLGEKAKEIKNLIEEANEVILKIVEIIMLLTPYGVFALVAKTFATLGYDAMKPLFWYVFTVILTLTLHALFTYQGMLYGFTRLSPIKFFRNFSPAMLVGFSTSSSSSTLPISIETAEKDLGVSNSVASFTLPLGATINMDGTAIMQGVATVFISQVYGIELGISEYLSVILTATLASIGTAGVPGVGIFMLSMVLQQVGLPVEGIALIIGIDRILDMLRTVLNITGDAVCTVIVAKKEGQLDEAVFNQ